MFGFVRGRSRGVIGTMTMVLLTGAGIATLSGCSAPGTAPTQTPAAQTTPSAVPSTPAAAEPTPAPEPWTKVDLTCTDLISPQQLYDYNPNFGADPNYSPSKDAGVAMIAKGDGLTCGLMNQSSNATIEIALGEPPADAMTDLKNDAITKSNFVPTYGVPEGYFAAADGIGEAQAFQGPYWLVMRSETFLEPGDVESLMKDALANLPKS